MMHVVAEVRGSGVFGVGDRGAGVFDRGADIGFRQGEEPHGVEGRGVEALVADASAECSIGAPPGPRSVALCRRARGLACQVLEDEVGGDSPR